MNDVQPLSPAEARKQKINTIPSFVVEAINQLLRQRFIANSVVIKQQEIIELAEKIGRQDETLPLGATRQAFFSQGWLNFEPLYSDIGWTVICTQPDYTESYDPYFTFEEKK